MKGFVYVVVLVVFRLTQVSLVSYWRYDMVYCLLGKLASGMLSDWVLRVKDIIQRQWSVCIVLIQRSANSVADPLAKNAATGQLTYSEWSSPSDDLLALLQKDIVT
ncbi:hypothetical protein PIB30_079972 [Stylosanthes scabra]|uniref:RNase H type-1 domain-containing protein n=1 Tax=Stylosanthes scabra TaxID=79078 RepID=A0ABU6SRE8_9FABA|nr:hypothetical protein [Stylosanthes scabra]